MSVSGGVLSDGGVDTVDELSVIWFRFPFLAAECGTSRPNSSSDSTVEEGEEEPSDESNFVRRERGELKLDIGV